VPARFSRYYLPLYCKPPFMDLPSDTLHAYLEYMLLYFPAFPPLPRLTTLFLVPLSSTSFSRRFPPPQNKYSAPPFHAPTNLQPPLFTQFLFRRPFLVNLDFSPSPFHFPHNNRQFVLFNSIHGIPPLVSMAGLFLFGPDTRPNAPSCSIAFSPPPFVHLRFLLFSRTPLDPPHGAYG